MRELRGKTAVITGGASGIGLAFAKRFGRAGCSIMLADIDAAALEEAVEGLQALDIRASGRIVDVADFAAVAALEEAARAEYGNVHLLFNNAGVSITGPTWAASED